MTSLRLVAFGIGVVLVEEAWRSAIITTVVPRRVISGPEEERWSRYRSGSLTGGELYRGARRWRVSPSILSSAVWELSRLLTDLTAAAIGRAGVRRDQWNGKSMVEALEQRTVREHRVLRFAGPLSVLGVVFAWLLLCHIGFTVLFWVISKSSFGTAAAKSTSALLTLGYHHPKSTPDVLLTGGEALTGIAFLGLAVTYAFTMVGLYSDRERFLRLLSSRMSYPANGPELLWRALDINGVRGLPALYEECERWSIDLAETHIAFPSLLLFRSSNAMQSWITSLLGVLDSAAIALQLCDYSAEDEARIRYCLRTGFLAFREVAHFVGVVIPLDPHPSPCPSAVLIDEQSFRDALRELEEKARELEEDHVTGVVFRDVDDAWQNFCGWRVNYAAAACGLASLFHAVPARWSRPPGTWTIDPRRPAHYRPQSWGG